MDRGVMMEGLYEDARSYSTTGPGGLVDVTYRCSKKRRGRVYVCNGYRYPSVRAVVA